MLMQKPRPRRVRRAVVKRRRVCRAYSRVRRGASPRKNGILVSIVTVPVFQEDGFWFRH